MSEESPTQCYALYSLLLFRYWILSSVFQGESLHCYGQNVMLEFPQQYSLVATAMASSILVMFAVFVGMRIISSLLFSINLPTEALWDSFKKIRNLYADIDLSMLRENPEAFQELTGIRIVS